MFLYGLSYIWQVNILTTLTYSSFFSQQAQVWTWRLKSRWWTRLTRLFWSTWKWDETRSTQIRSCSIWFVRLLRSTWYSRIKNTICQSWQKWKLLICLTIHWISKIFLLLCRYFRHFSFVFYWVIFEKYKNLIFLIKKNNKDAKLSMIFNIFISKNNDILIENLNPYYLNYYLYIWETTFSNSVTYFKRIHIG